MEKLQCLKCREFKTLDNFNKDAHDITGYYRPRCKECRRLLRIENADKEKARNKINNEKFHQRRKSDPEALKKRQEQNRRAAKKYQKLHPEASTVRHCRREAFKKNATGDFTKEEWMQLCERYGHTCLCCGQKKKLTADHIVPLARGGTNNIDNIQPLCQPCNSRKGAKTIDYRPITV